MSEESLTPIELSTDTEKELRVSDLAKVLEAGFSWSTGKMDFALKALLKGNNEIDTEIFYRALMKTPELYATFILNNLEKFEPYLSPEDAALLYSLPKRGTIDL